MGTAAIGTIGIEGFLQAPLPAEVGVLIVAFLLAKNSPKVYGRLKEMVPAEALAWLGSAPEEGKPSTLDIWLGRTPKRVVEAKREKPDEEETSDEDIAAYLRRSGVEEQEITTLLQPDDDEPSFEDPDLDASVPAFRRQSDSIFRFSELLRTEWRPSFRQIFVGRTMEGRDIFVSASDLCHVAIAGKTGGGKGSLMRLIMVQLCYVGASVTLLNPHYMRWVKAKEGEEFDEDWSPFEGNHLKTGKPYLDISPLEGAEFRTIFEYLAWAVDTLLQQRIREGRQGGIRFKPHFLVIDEWPAILGELGKGAATYLGKLLREGRKYQIFVIVASQDFQVKTMGVDGEGGVRKCLLTVFYTGGDMTTRKELLNEVTRETPENKIGKGVVLMRCTGTDNQSILARVPFVDNESVYLLLGSSTFHKAAERDEIAQTDGARSESRLLTFETITAWFEAGRINEKQFYALLSQLATEEEPEESDRADDPSFRDKAEAPAYVPPPRLLRATWKYEEYYPITQEAYRLGYTGKRKLADFIREHGKAFQVEPVGYGKALDIISEMQKRGMLETGDDEEGQEHAE